MTHHRRGLRPLLKDDELLAAVVADWRSAPLSEARQAMLEYAVKLTLTPAEIEEADVIALRAAGFSDRDILDIAEVVGYYAYANRIADGLGVQLEEWIPEYHSPLGRELGSDQRVVTADGASSGSQRPVPRRRDRQPNVGGLHQPPARVIS